MTDAPKSPQDPERLEPSDAFARLGQIMLAEESLDSVLQRVADLAMRTLPGADEVSVTLIEGTKLRSAAFTGQRAIKLDERQYAAGFGPCLDAAEAGETFQIRDTRTGDSPWPEFAGEAAHLGVLSTLSVGLPIAQRMIGALNIYAARPGAFDDESVEHARTFASYAAVALANASLYSSTAELARNLREAMHSRAVIDQAKGILMERHSIDAANGHSLLPDLRARA